MLLLMLACAGRTLPIPEPIQGSVAPKTALPEGESEPATFGSLDCGLTVGFAGVDEELSDLRVQDNGELLVVAELYKGRYEEALVLSLRDQGPTWFSVFGAGGDQDRPTAVVPVDDGFMVLGGTWSSGAGQNDMWLAHLDAAGQVGWQRTYGRYDRDLARGYVPNGQGGLLFGEMADYGALWLQLDPLGGVKGRGGIPGVKQLQVTALPDGSALLVGSRNDKGWGARVDAQGVVAWEAELPLVPVTTTLSSDGRALWLVGAEQMAQVDVQGVVGEEVTLPPELDGLNVQSASMGQGGLLILAEAEGGTGVFQLDEGGEVLWSQGVGSVDLTHAVLDGRGLVLMGQGQGARSQELYGLRLNADTGESLCIQVPPVEELPPSEEATPEEPTPEDQAPVAPDSSSPTEPVAPVDSESDA